jgi:hypothetical protein
MRHFSHFARTGRLGLLVLIISLLMLSSLASPVFAASTIRAIQLSPDNGPPNTVVTVAGTGFGIQEPVVITFDGQQIGSGTTNAQGAFTIKFTVPNNAQPGFHLVVATGQNSGRTAQATFLVQYQWNIVSSPGKGALNAVAAISANDIWAVGYKKTGTLTEQWNGTSWFIVPSPSPNSSSSLNSVAVVSTSDVWAVGQEYFPDSNTSATLVENWNGSRWSVVASPNPNSNSYLNSVAVVSASDIWAVGYTVTQQGQQTLIEQWNGSIWTVIASPSPGTYSNLSSVAVVSANHIWAVGYTNNKTLIEQWNGSRWKVVSSANSGSSNLSSVSVVSANDIWAVGSGSGANKAKTLAEHWNGTTWAIVPSPNPPSGPTGDGLVALAVVSSNNVWAVGYYGTGDAFTNPLIENWNGSKWKVVNSPAQGDYNSLSGVVSVPGTGHLWAVGYDAFVQGPDYTFTEYYG